MKLKIEHLAPYLPYNLKLMVDGEKANIAYMSTKRLAFCKVKTGIGEVFKVRWEHISNMKIKPILKPLSDLTNELDEIAIAAVLFLEESSKLSFNNNDLLTEGLMYKDIIELLKNNFDVFGLIKKELAIDINTLKS